LNDWDAAFDVTVQAPIAVRHAARMTPLRMIDIFMFDSLLPSCKARRYEANALAAAALTSS
jgi:hypothetical protein